MAPRAQRRILALNRGSSSLKVALYVAVNASDEPRLILSAKTSRTDVSGAHVQITDELGKRLFEGEATSAGDDDLSFVLEWLCSHGHCEGLAAIGHRIVHGGSKFTAPQRVTAETLDELERLIPLDPDHLPAALAGIRLVEQKFPDTPQVACFDTAFHSTLPKKAAQYALPRHFYNNGIRRYGFHGLSCEYVLSRLETVEAVAGKRERVIIAHLGSGASITAIRHGQSIDTSMGFTPLEGLVMATRSGDIDAGAVIFITNHREIRDGSGGPKATSSIDDMNHLLNKQSGLLGVSETSDDMRELLERSTTDPRAAEAIELFCYRAKKYIGAYAAALGGLDTIIFTAGIGERAATIRTKICAGLKFLSLEIDPSRNQINDPTISTANSQITVRVIPTNEELTIVRHVLAVLKASAAPAPVR